MKGRDIIRVDYTDKTAFLSWMLITDHIQEIFPDCVRKLNSQELQYKQVFVERFL